MIDFKKYLEEYDTEIENLSSSGKVYGVFKKSLQIFEKLKEKNENLEDQIRIAKKKRDKITKKYKNLYGVMIIVCLVIFIISMLFCYFHNLVGDNKEKIDQVKIGTIIGEIDDTIFKNKNLLDKDIYSEKVNALNSFNKDLITIRQQTIDRQNRKETMDDMKFYFIVVFISSLAIIIITKFISSYSKDSD